MRHECFKRIIRIIPTQTQRSRYSSLNIVETQEPINRLLGPELGCITAVDLRNWHAIEPTFGLGGIASGYKFALKSQIQLNRSLEKLKSPNTDASE